MKANKRIALLLGFLMASAWAGDKPVGITAQQPSMDVLHEGKLVRVQREPDNFNQIDPDFAMTSRPCPPYCVQPMQLGAGVETVGELELLDYLQRITKGDDSVMVIDSRDDDWLIRSGIIPGATHLRWEHLHPQHASPEAIADIFEMQFDVSRVDLFWNFENAKTLVFYCNGPWCGQSPTNIKQLMAMGYPAHKLKWYRGGMQLWKSLGLTTAPWKKK